jgi:hypothetical protein
LTGDEKPEMKRYFTGYNTELALVSVTLQAYLYLLSPIIFIIIIG